MLPIFLFIQLRSQVMPPSVAIATAAAVWAV